MVKPKRKNHLGEFPLRRKLVSTLLLMALFAGGIAVIYPYETWLIGAYLALWIVSYPVIFAGTCRYCANYGKPCPVVLEGGMVHRFFNRADKPFGMMQLAWASAAYMLRIAVPWVIIVQYQLWPWGIIYGMIFVSYWFFHLRITGCPNCVNYDCVLNPGRE
ncbi:MAG: hypothetical protein KA369_20115 [Spirochaetes bacterium]|nr:hypothetical protein [Spirochaetota bacterium]